MNRNRYRFSIRSVAASPRSRRDGASPVSRRLSGSGSGVAADLAGYMTREEFARYFELVNVGTEADPVTAIHALYAGLYTDGFLSGFGPGQDAGASGVGGGGLDEAELAAYLTDHA